MAATWAPRVPVAWYADHDVDGWGTGEPVESCDGPSGTADRDGDCADLAGSVNPGVVEQWYGGVDQDCDGNDADRDGDGWDLGEDCDDEDASVNPGAEEVYWGGDDSDCDGSEGDYDGDGYDSDAAITLWATETWYDGVDQDCDSNDDDADIDGYALADDCDGDLDELPCEACATAVIEGTSTYEHVGWSVDIGGDMGGDGLADLVTASSWGNRVAVFAGPLSGALTFADATATIEGGGDYTALGWGVATTGATLLVSGTRSGRPDPNG